MNVEVTVPGPVRIRVTDLNLLMEAVAYFERSGFSVRVAAEAGILDVERAIPGGAEAERETLEIHMGVWRAMYPDSPSRMGRRESASVALLGLPSPGAKRV